MGYSGKKITILGLGAYEHGSGIAAAKFFIRQNADLLITDMKTQEQLADQVRRVKEYAAEQNFAGTIEWRLGEHREEDVLNADVVVPNPGVPVSSKFVRLALDNNIPVESEMSLFFERCPAEIIGITGTRGKSTTTALIAHLLEGYSRKVWLGGNIAKSSPLEFLDQIKEDDRVVLELSNFMLEYLDFKQMSPHIAVLLNVLPDHLDRYGGDMDKYARAKEAITKYQSAQDVLIANRQNDYSRAIAERTNAKSVLYDHQQEIDGYFLRDSLVMERREGQETELVDATQVPLRGKHNARNILAAVACVRELEDDPGPMRQQIGSFASLEGRLQFIDEFKGVTFINDTTSTTPAAAKAAIESLTGRSIVLIAGGSDKGLDFSELAGEMHKVKAVVWLPGDGTDRFRAAVERASITAEQTEVSDMEQAVKQAYLLAEQGDAILLSPGCASFGVFKNEFDRGEQFDNAVAKLKATL